MQIKTTMRYHLTWVRMAIIKNLQTVNSGEGVEKREPSGTVGGNVNWCNHYGDQNGGSSKNQKQNYHMTQKSHSWPCILKKVQFEKMHATLYFW